MLCIYFRGEAIHNAAESQIRASQQEIIIDLALKNKLPSIYHCTSTGFNGFYLLSNFEHNLAQKVPQKKYINSENSVIDFFPNAIIDYKEKGEFTISNVKKGLELLIFRKNAILIAKSMWLPISKSLDMWT